MTRNDDRKIAFTLAEVFHPAGKSRKIAPRIIRVVTGVTSGSNSRAGFAFAHTAPYRKFGFTLAEVLITLGIIGVVAALTMPTLIANYQKQKTVTQLKKVYSTLNQAFKLSENFNGEFESWDKKDDVGAVAVYEKYWQPYLNGANVCTGYEDCGYKEKFPWQTLKGERKNNVAVSDNLNSRINVLLNDGTFISLSNQIYVDLNGPQKPNIYGKDFFVFTYNKRGVLPNMYEQDKDWIISRCSKNNNYDSVCCAERLIMVDNWEIVPDYPW